MNQITNQIAQLEAEIRATTHLMCEDNCTCGRIRRFACNQDQWNMQEYLNTNCIMDCVGGTLKNYPPGARDPLEASLDYLLN